MTASARPAPSQASIDECVANSHGNLPRVKEMVAEDPRLLHLSAAWIELPLQAAAHVGNRPIAEYLLAEGAVLDFNTACMLGMRAEVERLLADDPDLVHRRGVHDLGPLYFPAVGGQAGLVDLLLGAGADPDQRAKAGAPLHAAVMAGAPEIVRALLAAGAGLDATDFENRTPLDLCRHLGRDELATLLAEREGELENRVL